MGRHPPSSRLLGLYNIATEPKPLNISLSIIYIQTQQSKRNTGHVSTSCPMCVAHREPLT